MSKFKRGDQVRVIATKPKFSWGAVKRFDVGTISLVDSDGDLRVDFPNQKNWTALASELELLTKGGDMKPTQRKTYKQLKESVTVKKDALWQEACDDGTQEYVLLNAEDNKDPRQTQKIYERALVEDDDKNFVEVFAVTPAFMTQAELDQWDAFKKAAAKPAARKPRVAKVAPIKATRGRKVKKAA